MGYLEQGMQRYTGKQMDDAPYTTVEVGLIKNKTVDGYTVDIHGQQYTNVLALNSVSLVTNDTVAILIPNNQYSNMFILGKLGV